MSGIDPAHAAGERDAYDEMVQLAVGAGARNPLELRMGLGDALTAARWSALADPADPVLIDYLRLAGRFGAAATASIAGSPVALPLGDAAVEVPPGLPAEAITASRWSEALYAATAAGDAPTAMWVSRAELDVLPDDLAPDERELARALAAWWVDPDRVGAHLIAALEANDPATATGRERDRGLDLTAPAVAVLHQLLGDDDAGLEHAFAQASEGFERRHGAEATEVDGALSLPLCALARMAIETGRRPPTAGRAVPEVVVVQSPTLALGCPVCAHPFDPSETSCRWCGADLGADAPLELTVADVGGATRRACADCGRPNLTAAVRCWSCGASLPPG